MKIVISSGVVNGTTVFTEEGDELYSSDNAFDIVLYCQGLKEGYPEVEFVFRSDFARGAIFEAGKGDGKKLKRTSTRYVTFVSFGYMTDAKPSQGSMKAALEQFKKSPPNEDNCVIVDREEKIVEVMKGSVDVFVASLNIMTPGWKVGKIKRE